MPLPSPPAGPRLSSLRDPRHKAVEELERISAVRMEVAQGVHVGLECTIVGDIWIWDMANPCELLFFLQRYESFCAGVCPAQRPCSETAGGKWRGEASCTDYLATHTIEDAGRWA
jgi:hypothetical protein